MKEHLGINAGKRYTNAEDLEIKLANFNLIVTIELPDRLELAAEIRLATLSYCFKRKALKGL